jgi:hypothetical protein
VAGDSLAYSTTNGLRLTGKLLDLANENKKTLFEVPFKEARVIWGEAEAGQHILYPKTSRFLEGYVYEPTSQTIKRLPAFGYGLSAIATEPTILYQKQSPRGLRSYLWKREGGETTELLFSFFPEKCTFSFDTKYLYCGYSDLSQDVEFPDNWYRGEKKTADELWVTSVENKESTLLINPAESTGRELDIVSLTNTPTALYFINKNDQTLWVYDLIEESTQ